MSEPLKPQVARFSNLQPTKRSFSSTELGIPEEAMQMVTAHSVYSMMAPEGNKRKAAQPGVIGPVGLEVVVAQCPPGQGPGLHRHARTQETFFCLTGQFEVQWGPGGTESTLLNPLDILTVPPGVWRRFKNVSTLQDAKLLVWVQGGVDDAFNDVITDASLANTIASRFGPEVVQNFQKIGITFDKETK